LNADPKTESGTENQLTADIQRLAIDPSRQVFALVDGARFDDLPALLAEAGIAHRSLYRNVQDAELIRAGPWLVDPYNRHDPAINVWGGMPPSAVYSAVAEDAISQDTAAALEEAAGVKPVSGPKTKDPQAALERLMTLAGDTSCVVFWVGNKSLTEPALWRHLRTLNMALIPKEYNTQDALAPPEGEDTHDAVMFRHGDGNVLAEVLPVLDAAQFSRVFGPAQALMFLAPDHPASNGWN
jgi:Domain of unknown function (DUF4123)